MEFSFTDLINLVIQAIERIWPSGGVPDTVFDLVAGVVLVLAGIFAIYAFTRLTSEIIKLIKDSFVPLFYDIETRNLRNKRRRFAEYIIHQIERLNDDESWSKERFIELEAEIESHGHQKSWLPFKRERDTLRREVSLSKALQRSGERLILLEGMPASGKSVALRQVALKMAQKAAKSRSFKTTIPLYINLKSLQRRLEEERREHINNQGKDSSGISSSLYNQLRTALIDCGPFASDSKLKALFIDQRLSPWQNRLPQADSPIERVEKVIEFLHNRYSNMEENALVSLLRVLNERLDPEDACHQRLESLAGHVDHEVKSRKNTKSEGIEQAVPHDLDEPKRQPINQSLIRQYIIQSITYSDDVAIKAFVEDHFQQGLENGTWLFLFDSFDEIPEILSSTEADDIIRSYADAIDDFLHGMNHCRGIVASRNYRGPQRLSWVRFHIQPLSEKRQKALVKQAGLRIADQHKLIGELGAAPHEIQAQASNPMFLSLLCEYYRQAGHFPQNSHVIYEEFINQRLNKDAERLHRRFDLNTNQVRTAAEHLAFCMAADSNLGLNPTRLELEEATVRFGFALGGQFTKFLDALEYLGVARSEYTKQMSKERTFTFLHRRFQEYFATLAVLNEPSRVSPYQLLVNGQWREAIVVLFQTQEAASLKTIFAEVERILAQGVDAIPVQETSFNSTINEVVDKQMQLPQPFQWPPYTLHVLGILQDSFVYRADLLPGQIRTHADRILNHASQVGIRLDQKWSLEVAAVAPQDVLLNLIKKGFSSGSQLLRDVAYKQTAMLSRTTEDIKQEVFHTLAEMHLGGKLGQEKIVTRTHLSRIDGAESFIAAMNSLLTIRPISTALMVISIFSMWDLLKKAWTLSVPILRELFVLTVVYCLVGPVLYMIRQILSFFGFTSLRLRFFALSLIYVLAILVALNIVVELIDAWVSIPDLIKANITDAQVLEWYAAEARAFWTLRSLLVLLLPGFIIVWEYAVVWQVWQGLFFRRAWFPLIPIVTLPLTLTLKKRGAYSDWLEELKALWLDARRVIAYKWENASLENLIGILLSPLLILALTLYITILGVPVVVNGAMQRTVSVAILVYDFIRFRNLQKYLENHHLTVGQLLQVLSEIQTLKYYKEVIRLARRQRQIRATQDELNDLVQLSLTVEQIMTKRRMDVLLNRGPDLITPQEACYYLSRFNFLSPSILLSAGEFGSISEWRAARRHRRATFESLNLKCKKYRRRQRTEYMQSDNMLANWLNRLLRTRLFSAIPFDEELVDEAIRFNGYLVQLRRLRTSKPHLAIDFSTQDYATWLSGFQETILSQNIELDDELLDELSILLERLHASQ